VHYGRGASEADGVVGEIQKAGGRGVAVAADLERTDGPHKLAKLARDIVGDRLDILVPSQKYLKFQPPRAARSSFCVGYPRIALVRPVLRSM
jgi:hypothetical protein